MKQPTNQPTETEGQPTITETIVNFGHYMSPPPEDQPIANQEIIRQDHLDVDLNKPGWQFVFQYMREDGSPLGTVIHYQGRWFRYVIWEMDRYRPDHEKRWMPRGEHKSQKGAINSMRKWIERGGYDFEYNYGYAELSPRVAELKVNSWLEAIRNSG